MLSTINRLMALMLVVLAMVLALNDEYAHAAFTMGLAIFSQLLAQEE